MIVRCPNCNGALEFDSVSGQMFCAYCCNYYSVDQINNSNQADKQENINTHESDYNGDYIETDIYSCTSCGAELMINNVESATFCAYCGQPTIVYSRVSKCRRPQFIIPFSVTKQQALAEIKNTLKKNFFVSGDIKNFKVEMLRGIYVPFWLYDVRYQDRVVIEGRGGNVNGNSRTIYAYRDGVCDFKKVTIDASARFNDESSQRLEPYDVNGLVPFNENYLSGYYADCSDDEVNKMDYVAVSRCKELFDKEICETVKISTKKVIKSNARYNIENVSYALLPAWFLVFRNEGKTYTIMANGQTGKVVGAVPKNSVKEKLFFIVLALFFALVFGTIFVPLGNNSLQDDSLGEFFGYAIIGIASSIMFGVKNYKDYARSQELTTDTVMRKIVSERQEGDSRW